jgi:lipopolysaccharide export system protein LptA
VRMWQGGNQIQAAVIELSNTEKRLVARGDGMLRGANSEQVLMVLAGSGEKASGGRGAGVGTSGCVSSAAGKTTSGAAAMDASSAGVTRIASGGLTYSATTRELDFTGGLRAETSDGTIRAGQGTAYLRKANASSADAAATASATASSALSGDLDRVVMTGSVELDRPGLKAFGKRLVYTANDRSAVLTGDEKNLPRAVEAQGTTTGAALRFRSSCDGRGGGSVEVLGTMGQRVHTDATVSNGRKNEKGK